MTLPGPDDDAAPHYQPEDATAKQQPAAEITAEALARLGVYQRKLAIEHDAAVLQDDLRQLLALLGMGTHARPQSPHEVFQEALVEVRRRVVALRNAQACMQDCADIAARPTYRALEVGFRHTPLTTKEAMERYAETCRDIAADLNACLEGMPPASSTAPVSNPQEV